MIRARRILIAGCGYVGSALARLLVADSLTVFGMRRRPEGLPEGVHPVAADLSRPDSLASIPAEIDQVVYAVGAGASTEEAYRAAYVDGPRALMQFLTRRGDPVARWIFVSSTGVYAQEDGSWVDETSPAESGHFSGRLLLEGERGAAEGPFPSVALRLAGIYGPGRPWLLERVARREVALTPEIRFTNRIHRDDCAGAIRHLLALDAPEPLYLGCDSEPGAWNDVILWLAHELGVPDPPVGEGSAIRPGRGNKRCRNERLLGSGYRFRFPTWREGYRDVIRDYFSAEPGLDRSTP